MQLSRKQPESIVIQKHKQNCTHFVKGLINIGFFGGENLIYCPLMHFESENLHDKSY